MKLEDQVCSLEFSKKLEELRVKQDSLFYYVFDGDTYWICSNELIYHIENKNAFYTRHLSQIIAIESYSAFTSSELGILLPSDISVSTLNEDINIWWCEANEGYGEVTKWKITESKKEADARAKMLIYLIENQLWWLPK